MVMLESQKRVRQTSKSAALSLHNVVVEGRQRRQGCEQTSCQQHPVGQVEKEHVRSVVKVNSGFGCQGIHMVLVSKGAKGGVPDRGPQEPDSEISTDCRPVHYIGSRR